MSIERIPLCRVPYCPAPTSPEYHECWCGSKEIEHHHALGRGSGGTKIKKHIVALCNKHHRAIHSSECSERILDLPTTGKTYVYYDTDGTIRKEEPLGEAESPAASTAGVPDVLGVGDGSSPSAAAPPASPLSSAEEAGKLASAGGYGLAAQAQGNAPGEKRQRQGNRTPSDVVPACNSDSSSAEPSVFKEDWSSLSDDDLQLKYDTAGQMQGMAFLIRCKAVHAFRDNHVQAWHESWTDHAIERFNISRRYCFAFANLWEIAVNYDTNHILPLTESRSLMQCIGRRSLKDGKAAMEVAVAHHAEFAEPPSVGQLEHSLGEEREPKDRHECPTCGQEHAVRNAK